MALITTTGNLIRQYNAFTGLSATERSQSGIARAEVVYYNVNDTWASPGAGNSRLYQTGQISLPKDFGYVLTDLFVMVSRESGGDVFTEMVGNVRMFPGGTLGPQINTILKATPGLQDGVGNTNTGSIDADKYNTIRPGIIGDDGSITYVLADPKPSMIIYPFNAAAYTTVSNPASIFEWGIGEQVVNGGEYNVSSYARFLQYDIDQSYNYVIQSPQLTR